MRLFSTLALWFLWTASLLAGQARTNYPDQIEGDYVIENFKFVSGESLPQLRLHYTTIGKPVKDGSGVVRNAVLIMHGTTGNGASFVTNRQFAGGLFGPGQLLDAATHYLILPDAIGHGKSSKPSDGLHMKFPRYTYDDMVKAQYEMLTKGLGVNHMRLVMGTSMGGMMTWVWGYMYPDFMDALMPLASLPVEIAGRNRMMRKMMIDAIKNDPEWKNGEYQTPPRLGMISAINVMLFMVSSPLQWQKSAPTRVEAERSLESRTNSYLKTMEANDMIYQYDASRDYNPAPHLEEIKAPLYAINSADDQVNPPELGILDREIKRVKRGRYILIPISDQTSGHGTHSNPAIWGKYLAELLAEK
jgi:homoserine O-acetyltransferase/O-succinyltransferase